MDPKELQRQIAELRAELSGLVTSGKDLSHPAVLAKSAELDGLVMLYHRLKNSGRDDDSTSHQSATGSS